MTHAEAPSSLESGDAKTEPLRHQRLSVDEMRARAAARLAAISTRRSVRHFAADPVPLDVVRTCIEIANAAPSGANKQPWTFVLVTDDDTKQRIRAAAEEEERRFYDERASPRWLDDLAHLGTDANKPHLTDAPVLIVVFAQKHGPDDEQHYYVQESVGLASGFLIAALHEVGLATLTHTPSPMGFLRDLLARPAFERPFLLLPVGYPAADCRVPVLSKKPLSKVLVEP